MEADVFPVTVIADQAMMNPTYTRVNGINDLSNEGEYVNFYIALDLKKSFTNRLTDTSISPGQSIVKNRQEGEMGIYGNFNARYCVIIQLCGMRFFIILADGIQ